MAGKRIAAGRFFWVVLQGKWAIKKRFVHNSDPPFLWRVACARIMIAAYKQQL